MARLLCFAIVIIEAVITWWLFETYIDARQKSGLHCNISECLF